MIAELHKIDTGLDNITETKTTKLHVLGEFILAIVGQNETSIASVISVVAATSHAIARTPIVKIKLRLKLTYLITYSTIVGAGGRQHQLFFSGTKN